MLENRFCTTTAAVALLLSWTTCLSAPFPDEKRTHLTRSAHTPPPPPSPVPRPQQTSLQCISPENRFSHCPISPRPPPSPSLPAPYHALSCDVSPENRFCLTPLPWPSSSAAPLVCLASSRQPMPPTTLSPPPLSWPPIPFTSEQVLPHHCCPGLPLELYPLPVTPSLKSTCTPSPLPPHRPAPSKGKLVMHT